MSARVLVVQPFDEIQIGDNLEAVGIGPHQFLAGGRRQYHVEFSVIVSLT